MSTRPRPSISAGSAPRRTPDSAPFDPAPRGVPFAPLLVTDSILAARAGGGLPSDPGGPPRGGWGRAQAPRKPGQGRADERTWGWGAGPCPGWPGWIAPVWAAAPPSAAVGARSGVTGPVPYKFPIKSRALRWGKSVTGCFNWSRRQDLNPRPSDYKSDALPTELRRRLGVPRRSPCSRCDSGRRMVPGARIELALCCQNRILRPRICTNHETKEQKKDYPSVGY